MTSNWPLERGLYKVIQIYINEKPLIYFSEDTDYHCIMLEQILNDHKIPFLKNVRRIPSLEGDKYKVCGMGLMQISIDIGTDSSGKKIYFFQRSVDYGIGISRDHIEKIKNIISKEITKIVFG